MAAVEEAVVGAVPVGVEVVPVGVEEVQAAEAAVPVEAEALCRRC